MPNSRIAKKRQEQKELTKEMEAEETHKSAISNFQISEKYGYRFIMDVKKIREERYYKELGYSDFNEYCKDSWNVDKWFINERIKIANEFTEEEFGGYSHQFGHKKSLLLARMDEPQRKQAVNKGIPTKNGTKSYKEATQNEIGEFKKHGKSADKQRGGNGKNKESSEQRFKRLEQELQAERKERERLEKVAYKEPDTKTEYVEKKPDNYEQLRKENEQLRKEINDLRSKYEIDELGNAVSGFLKGDHRELTADLKRIVNKHEGLKSEGARIIELSKEDEESRENMNCFITFWETLIERTFKDEAIGSGIV